MPDRTIVPVIQPIDQLILQKAEEVRLDNGIRLFLLKAGQQPVMRLEIIFNAGKWFENKPGLSYFTGKMLTEGTKKKTTTKKPTTRADFIKKRWRGTGTAPLIRKGQ